MCLAGHSAQFVLCLSGTHLVAFIMRFTIVDICVAIVDPCACVVLVGKTFHVENVNHAGRDVLEIALDVPFCRGGVKTSSNCDVAQFIPVVRCLHGQLALIYQRAEEWADDARVVIYGI